MVHSPVLLVPLILTLLICQTRLAITRPQILTDVYGNLLNNNDAKFPASECCMVPTCRNPYECYHTFSCGYMCGTGKYPPAEHRRTPGYRLKDTYSKYDCRFGDCRYYDFTCSHCKDPRDNNFSIYLVREDCKECYYLG